MSGKETIGVVIPTFNSADTIVRALESVLRQTLAPKKIVVVDNASSDTTCHVVESFSTQYPELHINLVRLDTNLGPGAARNIGWEKCGTSLIAFLDSDDSWHPRKLELQTELVRKHPDGLLFGHRYLVVTSNSQPRDVEISNFSRTHRYWLRHFLFRNRLSTPTVMLRSTIPQRFPSDMWHAEDFFLWTVTVAQTGPAIFDDAILTYLYKPAYGSSGLSAQLRKMHQGELTVLKSLAKFKLISCITYVLVFLWMRIKYFHRRVRGICQ